MKLEWMKINEEKGFLLGEESYISTTFASKIEGGLLLRHEKRIWSRRDETIAVSESMTFVPSRASLDVNEKNLYVRAAYDV